VEYSIVAKRHSDLPMLNRLLRRLADKDRGKLHILEPKGFHNSQVLVEVELNGHTRTINIKDVNKIRAYFDITDEVSFGRDGHPTFRSMLRESRELINDIWRSLKAPQSAN
jgi:hypothetical protein